MKIELYMASIDEDFSSRTLKQLMAHDESDKGILFISKETKQHTQNNWANWGNWDNWDNWTNWTNWSNSSATQRVVSQDPFYFIDRIRVRGESFGGLAFNPISKRVLKLDMEAYSALKLLVEGISVETIASQMGVQNIEIESLVSCVSKI